MRAIVFLLFAIVIISCQDDREAQNTVCTDIESIEQTPWLVELKNSITNCSCEVSIIKGEYERQTVFFVALTDPLCNGINSPSLFNCEGKVVRSFTSAAEDQKELADKVTIDTILYRCKK